MIIRTASLAAVAFAAATISFPAFAAERVPEVQINYADLDLTSDNGRAELRSRVSEASAQICSRMGYHFTGGCRADLTQRTMASIKLPTRNAVATR